MTLPEAGWIWKSQDIEERLGHATHDREGKRFLVLTFRAKRRKIGRRDYQRRNKRLVHELQIEARHRGGRFRLLNQRFDLSGQIVLEGPFRSFELT